MIIIHVSFIADVFLFEIEGVCGRTLNTHRLTRKDNMYTVCLGPGYTLEGPGRLPECPQCLIRACQTLITESR